MGNIASWLIRGLAAAALGWLADAPVAAQTKAPEDYKPAEVQEIKRNPQKFWARAISFKDVLESKPSRSIEYTFNNRPYRPFTTRTLGNCYLASELEPLLRDLPLNREYSFMGTILQERAGRYAVLVQSVGAIVDAGQSAATLVKPLPPESAAAFDDNAAGFAELWTNAQEAFYIYARSKQISMRELFDPDSEHYERAKDIIRNAIRNSEQRWNTPAGEMFTYHLAQIFRRQLITDTEPPEPTARQPDHLPATEPPLAPPPSSEPAAPALTDTSVPVTNTAPARRSWWSRLWHSDPSVATNTVPAAEEKAHKKEAEEKPRRGKKKPSPPPDQPPTTPEPAAPTPTPPDDHAAPAPAEPTPAPTASEMLASPTPEPAKPAPPPPAQATPTPIPAESRHIAPPLAVPVTPPAINPPSPVPAATDEEDWNAPVAR